MGLLRELDLDALLTSHEEWGFYAELDGLSTYHLVRDPEGSLRALFERVLPGVGWSFTDPSLRDNRHQLYGNSVKHHQLTIADVREDLKWQTEMPPEYSRVVLALSYPLRLRYGY